MIEFRLQGIEQAKEKAKVTDMSNNDGVMRTTKKAKRKTAEGVRKCTLGQVPNGLRVAASLEEERRAIWISVTTVVQLEVIARAKF